jgi:peptidoglycan/LPS O-acetylase OafA/YrhL
LTQPASPREIVPLTALRGVAALWVVALHFAGNLDLSGFVSLSDGPLRNMLRGGELAVDVFFVLSGYVLAMTWREGQPVSAFWIRRVGRIFPLHLVVLAGMAVGVWAMLRMGVKTRDMAFFDFRLLPEHATLTFIWLGLPIGWNAPTWSLSVEFAGYILFPVVMAVLLRVSRPSLPVVTGLLALSTAAVVQAFDLPHEGPQALLCGFLGIATGASLWLGGIGPLARAPSLCALAILVLLAFDVPGPAVLPIVGLVAGLALPEPTATGRVLSHSAAAWLGKVSYAIYLLHAPLLILFLQVLRRLPALQSATGLAAFAVVYVAVLLAAAELAHRVVERPGIRAARHLAGRVAQR